MVTQNHFVIPVTVLEKFKFPQEWCQAASAHLFLNQGGPNGKKRLSFSTDLQRIQFLDILEGDFIKMVLTCLEVL